MDIISLIVFCAVIVAGFAFKTNTGLVAIMAAMLLCMPEAVGISGSEVNMKAMLGYFDGKMFLMLFGVMYLFCIAQENKTLDVLAKKTIALCKGKVRLFPVILFLLGAVLSAIGPGPISITALLAAIIVALAKEIGCHPMKLLPFGTLGSFAGALSPITPSGIVAIGKAEEAGIMGIDLALNIKMFLVNLLAAAVLYFFVYRWHKFQNDSQKQEAKESLPFTWKQWATLLGILLVAVLAFLGVNVGPAAISVAAILTILRCADESVALKKVPYNTLIMITGVGILIKVVFELGGINLLSSLLQNLIGQVTASAIISVLAGVMSWFSSASGVVMPTLIPMVPELAPVADASALQIMTIALCIGAHLAALSPLSSCGGLMLSAYSSTEGVTEQDRSKVFFQLFGMSAAMMLGASLLALAEGLLRTFL